MQRCMLALLLAFLSGCAPRQPQVIVYTALDEEFARGVYEQFERATGIRVRAKYDTEAAKTVGLVNLLLTEHRTGAVRCDLFWNNEILGTMRLLAAGALEPVSVPEAADIPAKFRSPQGYWYGFAARARVLLVNTEELDGEEAPGSVFELAEPRWRGRFAIANPLFGTTATHMVCLFEVLGPQRAKEWLQQLWANKPLILPGNRHVAEAVAAGRVPVGLTDTDDALGQLRRGAAVDIIFPDADGLGTLLLPNTLAVIKGAPHRRHAERLIRYLLDPAVEKQLALGPSGQIPLHRALRAAHELSGTLPGRAMAELKPMNVDFERAARWWDEAIGFLSELVGVRQVE